MATSSNNTTPISSLTADPVLRAFFERGERDTGNAYAIPSPTAPVLAGGAEALLVLA